MAKPMTAEQIEAELTELVGNDYRLADPGILSLVRQGFTLGQDNGQAIILERAETILPTVNLEHEAIGRALMTIIAWLSVDLGRSFQSVRPTSSSSPEYAWVACVMRSDADKARESWDSWSEYVFSSTPVEAMAKLATWCTEHAIAWPNKVSAETFGTYDRMLSATGRTDTEPPPAEEPTPDTERNS